MFETHRDVSSVSDGTRVAGTAGPCKPVDRQHGRADMHTHSVYSHDSVCEIEAMCRSQLSKGTTVFAVTDHCDVFAYNQYDIYSPLVSAAATVEKLNKIYGGDCLLLSGVEISEGFWYPQEYQKVHDLLPYDVIIGSVHCVKCPDYEMPYSAIDFSKFTDEQIHTYLDCYFDDIITMLNTTDFDVLAHLTCPMRYIVGKYGRKVDLQAFDGKITHILDTIRHKGIALEVNTSSYAALGDSLPGRDILKQYADRGGQLLTLGSDAHVAENASSNFDRAITALKEIGFRTVYYYKQRQAYPLSI